MPGICLLKKLFFKEVYPLYGQIDIKGSSVARNEAIEKDLTVQIERLLRLLRFVSDNLKLPVIYQNIFELEDLEKQLKETLKADTESLIQSYVLNEVHPMLHHFKDSNEVVRAKVDTYFKSLDPKIMMVYDARKDFDETLSLINKKMAFYLIKNKKKPSLFPTLLRTV